MDALNYKVPQYSKNSEIYKMRHQINMDDYATFKWRGMSSYDEKVPNKDDTYQGFGCFIINNKDLQWTNYAGFSDEFTKPMFSSFPAYMGTTFNQKQIKIKLGIYWITHDDYRAFLNWFSPEIVGNFEFDYNKGWQYRVKVSNLTETTYYTIGINENGENVYYAELTLTLKTVEDNAVTYKESWPYSVYTNKEVPSQSDPESIPHNYYILTHDNIVQNLIINNPITPVNIKQITPVSELSTDLHYYDTITWSGNYIDYAVYLKILPNQEYGSFPDSYIDTLNNEQSSYLLFNFTTNIMTDVQNYPIKIDYYAQTGQLLINNQIISDINTLDSAGNQIINSYQVNKFILPGSLNNKGLDYKISASMNDIDFNVTPFVLELVYQCGENFETRQTKYRWPISGTTSKQEIYNTNNTEIWSKREL